MKKKILKAIGIIVVLAIVISFIDYVLSFRPVVTSVDSGSDFIPVPFLQDVFYAEKEGAYYVTHKAKGFLGSQEIYRIDERSKTIELVLRTIPYDSLSCFVVDDKLFYKAGFSNGPDDLFIRDLTTGHTERLDAMIWGCIYGIWNNTVYYSDDDYMFSKDLASRERKTLFTFRLAYESRDGIYREADDESEYYDFYNIYTGEMTPTAVRCSGGVSFGQSGECYLDRHNGVLHSMQGEILLDLNDSIYSNYGLSDRYAYRWRENELTLWDLADLNVSYSYPIDKKSTDFDVCTGKVFIYPKDQQSIQVIDIVSGETTTYDLP